MQFTAFMRGLKEVDPRLALIGTVGMMTDPESQAAAKTIAQGDALLRDKAVKLPADQKLGLAFDDKTGSIWAGRGLARETALDAVKTVYAALSEKAGGSGGYTDNASVDSARMQQAIDIAIGKTTSYNGQTIILPRMRDAQKFTEAARSQLYFLNEAGRLPGRVDGRFSNGEIARLPLLNGSQGGRDGYFVVHGGDRLIDVTSRPVFIDPSNPTFSVRPPASDPLAPIAAKARAHAEAQLEAGKSPFFGAPDLPPEAAPYTPSRAIQKEQKRVDAATAKADARKRPPQ